MAMRAARCSDGDGDYAPNIAAGCTRAMGSGCQARSCVVLHGDDEGLNGLWCGEGRRSRARGRGRRALQRAA